MVAPRAVACVLGVVLQACVGRSWADPAGDLAADSAVATVFKEGSNYSVRRGVVDEVNGFAFGRCETCNVQLVAVWCIVWFNQGEPLQSPCLSHPCVPVAAGVPLRGGTSWIYLQGAWLWKQTAGPRCLLWVSWNPTSPASGLASSTTTIRPTFSTRQSLRLARKPSNLSRYSEDHSCECR